MEKTDEDEITPQEVEELYQKILKFYEDLGNPKINIIWLSNIILKRLRNDFDWYTNCEGIKGCGKSNLILLLGILQCRYAGIYKNKITGKLVKVLPRTTPLPKDQWEMVKFGFQISKNMSFVDNTDDVRRKFNLIERYSPFIIDEGSKNLHKYEWQSKLQFLLVKLSDTERYQNKAFYVCFPNFRELNTVFRNDRIMMRLYLYERNETRKYASCIISLKDVNRYVADPWHTDDNSKRFEELLKRVPISNRGPSHILYAEKRLAGFAGEFRVPSLKHLAPRIWKIYMKYKIANAQRELKTENMERETKLVDRWKYAYKMLVKYISEKEPYLKAKNFEEMTGIGQNTIKKLVENKTDKELELERKDNRYKEV